MRALNRNKTTFWYALYQDREPLYDEYGNETGEGKPLYSKPVSMRANVSAASGSAQIEQFGNLTSYDRVIVTDDMSCPITETSVLFIEKEPEADNPVHDYIVRRVAKSLNTIAIAVSKVTVS